MIIASSCVPVTVYRKKNFTRLYPPTSCLQAVDKETKRIPTSHDVEERENVSNRFVEARANRPAVPVVPTGTPVLKQQRRSAIKRIGPGDEDGHARSKEANGCAILKRVAMMKTEPRRALNSSM
ncbi:hypothetical protein T06_1106 [Trichinella sp. T6]|nr:hypothetical protein T06_1106 [Trichinella sp. T6]